MKMNFKQTHAIFLLTLFDQIAITVSFPVLTFLCFDSSSHLFASTTSYVVRSHWFGMLNALPHLVAIVAAPLLCLLSDYFGRKSLLVIGAAGAMIFSCFSIISIFSSMLIFMIIGYALNGLCVRTEPIALAALADCSDYKNRLVNMSYLQFWISAGAFIGPLLGGYLAKRYFFPQLNFSLPYFVGVLAGLLALFSTIFLFRETLSREHRSKSPVHVHWHYFLNKKIGFLLMILILTQLGWRLYYVFMPAVLKLNFAYSPVGVGSFMALIALWLALASGVGMKVLAQYFSEKAILRGAIISVFVGLLLANLPFLFSATRWSLWIIVLSAIPIAVGDVIIYSLLSSLFSKAVSSDQQGFVMGLNFIVVASVWSLTGLGGGFLSAIDSRLPIILAPVSLLIVLGIEYFGSRLFWAGHFRFRDIPREIYK